MQFPQVSGICIVTNASAKQTILVFEYFSRF